TEIRLGLHAVPAPHQVQFVRKVGTARWKAGLRSRLVYRKTEQLIESISRARELIHLLKALGQTPTLRNLWQRDSWDMSEEPASIARTNIVHFHDRQLWTLAVCPPRLILWKARSDWSQTARLR